MTSFSRCLQVASSLIKLALSDKGFILVEQCGNGARVSLQGTLGLLQSCAVVFLGLSNTRRFAERKAYFQGRVAPPVLSKQLLPDILLTVD